MQVLRAVGAVVADLHVAPVAGGVARLLHRSIANREDGGAIGRGVVGAQVRLEAFLHRVEAPAAEARRDPAVLQRGLQEGLAQAVARGVEEVRYAVLCKAVGVLGHPVALVAGGQHPGLAVALPVHLLLLVDHGEAVALLDAVEIHRPGVDLGQLHAQHRVGAGIGQVVVQGAGHGHAHLGAHGLHGAVPHAYVQWRGQREHHVLHGVHLVHEVARFALVVVGVHEGDGVALAHAAHVELPFTQAHQAVDHRVGHAPRGEQVAEGGAPAHLLLLHHEARQWDPVGRGHGGHGIHHLHHLGLRRVLHPRRQVHREQHRRHRQQRQQAIGHRAFVLDHGSARKNIAPDRTPGRWGSFPRGDRENEGDQSSFAMGCTRPS